MRFGPLLNYAWRSCPWGGVMSAIRCYGDRFTVLLLCAMGSSVHALSLTNTDWHIEIDPATLATTAQPPSGRSLIISRAAQAIAFQTLQQDAVSARWQYGAATEVSAHLTGNRLILRFFRSNPGDVAWPLLPSGARALILPIHEGYYVPARDEAWRQWLSSDFDGMNTTEHLSLPVFGLDYGQHVVSVLFANPFNNQLRFTPDTNGIGVDVRHRFTRLDVDRPYEVQITLSGADWLAPAKQYRQWLQSRGEFVSLQTKLAAATDGERLIGASHVYLWGDRLLVPQDVKDWRMLRQLMPAGWAKGEARQALNAPNLANERYLQSVLIAALNQALLRAVPGGDAASVARRKQAALTAVGPALAPMIHWGDAVSVGMIARLRAAGLEKLWLGLPQWTAGFASPQGVAAARAAGYLIGPYDSYDTALPEANNNPSWLTAQLGEDAFRRCGILLENGQRKTGFQGEGVYTNPTCVRPLMERRVAEIQAASQYNSWFLDVDGTGMLFDDVDPAKRTSEAQDATNRVAGMAWIGESQGIVVGSEDGAAVVNRSIAFAHGMQTAGFGWQDVDMRKNPLSPYYLGAWYPLHQPATFFKTSEIKPVYQSLFFDPAKRLPLFQAAFHDSVITTHHWTLDSLKFKQTRAVTELLQQLYNVPPLLNLSLDTASARIAYLRQLDGFFRPLHQRLYAQALTGFRWLNHDGSLQETRFADGTRIVANFADQAVTAHNRILPGHSALAIFPDENTLRFQSRDL